jgi:hypothetical protein
MSDTITHLKELREQLLLEIQPLLPTETAYLAESVPYVACIKYLEPDGNVSFFNGHGYNSYELNPHDIEEMPVEALAKLLEILKARREAGK